MRKKIARRARIPALRATRRNEKWSMDFVAARFPMYYGTEFASKAMDVLPYRYGVHLDFIRPANRWRIAISNHLADAYATNG